MRIWKYHRYGSADVLRLEDEPTPQPSGTEVLVKVHAAGVNAYDWRLMRANPFLVRLAMGFFRPKIGKLGADIAGVVEAVGPAVTKVSVGDAVYGDVAGKGNGGFAEYALSVEDRLAPIPEGLSFVEAAAMPMAGLTALQGVRDVGGIQAGQRVAINGASGGVGTFAVQIAKALGGEVTAVCSGGKAPLARSIGADHVIDYTSEDFTASGTRYDLIVAVNGFQPLRSYVRALESNGTFVMAGGKNRQIFQSLLLMPLMHRKDGPTLARVNEKPNREDYLALNELVAAGKLRPVIDTTYAFTDVPDAIRHVERGHAAGKVVVTVAE